MSIFSIETLYFLSLGIIGCLVVLLIIHFRNKLITLEKQVQTFHSVASDLIGEMKRNQVVQNIMPFIPPNTVVYPVVNKCDKTEEEEEESDDESDGESEEKPLEQLSLEEFRTEDFTMDDANMDDAVMERVKHFMTVSQSSMPFMHAFNIQLGKPNTLECNIRVEQLEDEIEAINLGETLELGELGDMGIIDEDIPSFESDVVEEVSELLEEEVSEKQEEEEEQEKPLTEEYYKKLSLPQIKQLAVEKGLTNASSKLKKNELIQLLLQKD